MLDAIKRVLALYLIAFIINIPWINTCAAGQRSVAVVEVFDNNSSTALGQMRHKLESFLLESKRVRLVGSDKIVAYFSGAPATADDIHLTKGDELFRMAADLNDAFKAEKAFEVVTVAIEELKKDCGRQGNLVGAYLLKASIELDQDKKDDAYKSLQDAVSLNPEMNKIDEYKYSPAIRSLYAKAFQRFALENTVLEFTINTEGGASVPIYINSVLRGHGPMLKYKAVDGKSVILAYGEKGRGKSVVPDKNSTILKVKGAAQASSKSVGLKSTDDAALVSQAVTLGNTVGADQVILVKLDNVHPMDQFAITVVDVKRGRASPVKAFELIDVSDDGDKVAKLASDFVLNPGAMNAQAFAANTSNQTTTPLDAALPKRKKSSGIFIGSAIGVLVVGAGIGAVLALSGGGGPTTPTTVTTSVSGPIPTAQ